MLTTLRSCPPISTIVNQDFQRDLNWFSQYLPNTYGVHLIHDELRGPINLYMDACHTGGGAIAGSQAYRAQLPLLLISTDQTSNLDFFNFLVFMKKYIKPSRVIHYKLQNLTPPSTPPPQ